MRSKLGKIALAGLLAVLVLVAAPVVLAQTSAPDIGLDYATQIGLTTTDVRTTTSNIIRAFMGGLGMLAVGIIIYAGFLWMTAGGEPEKTKTAQRMIGYSVLGLVVIFSAYAIARFVFGALGVDVGGGPVGGCIPGQVCSSGGGGGFGGSSGGFRIQAVSPVGLGPRGNGWPKNFGITVSFSGAVTESSINAASFKVVKCNPLGLVGSPNAFVESECDETNAVAGTFEFDGNKVTFRPVAAAGVEPTFEANVWYRVQVKSNLVTGLVCPFRVPADLDISSTTAPRDLCERAMVFSDALDAAAPTVSLDQPVSPPAYCADFIPVLANANDDFLVSNVNFLVDGGTDGLFGRDGAPAATIGNAENANPFSTNDLSILSSFFRDGKQHQLTAVAHDGAGKSSPVAKTSFAAALPHCCNEVVDVADKETGLNCGVDSGCGACSGSSCSADSQCQSGFCDAASHLCVERPIIDDISPSAGGEGTLVTAKGRFFGSTPGSIVFVGDEKDPSDDVTATPCATGAWSNTQVTFPVPTGAKSGLIKLVAASGQSAVSPSAFTVGGPLIPGICLLEPFSGAVGSGLVIHGVGFGAAKNQSLAMFGDQTLSIGQGGWSDTTITTIVPNIHSGEYPVSVTTKTALGVKSSNAVTYKINPSASETQPQITALLPAAGSVGSSFTIQGTGFGTSPGVVRLYFGNGAQQEIAIADQPACQEFWHDTYVVVKVPERYQSGAAMRATDAGEIHKVELETAGNVKTARLDFKVNHAAVKPTICSITPDNGPAGRSVTIVGEGFGNGPGSGSTGSNFVVEFFKTQSSRVSANVYGDWKTKQVITAVPGDAKVRSTWPASGPVTLKANGQESANAIPFTIQNCTDAGVSCPEKTTCCANGSCADSCEAPARTGGYGWQLSTDVLPSIPRVVERASCDKNARTIQSPSPFKGSADACANAALVVEFTRKMQENFNSSTVKVVECGSADQADCNGGTSVGLGYFLTSGSDQETVLTAGPDSSYNGGLWKNDEWYQVALLSDALTAKGLQDVAGKFLDGDRDGVEGGDYVWNFRAKLGGQSCDIDHVTVSPGSTTIKEQGGNRSSAAVFISMLTAGNCNALRCTDKLKYDISWSAKDFGFLDLLKSEFGNDCPGALQPVLGLKETDLGKSVPLVADVSSSGRSLANGTADVTVKFADPTVVTHGPDCDLACVNSDVYALFNVPMDASTFAPERGNVELMKCRNAACNPPFDAQAINVVEVPDANDPAVTRGLSLAIKDAAGNQVNLEPDTDYLVRIKGGDLKGVLSSSGVPLTHLTDGSYFTWTFHTKNSTTACAVNKSTVSPKQLTMNYIGERAEFRVLPFGAPDQCDSRGQALRAESYNWVWDSIGGFVSGFIDPVQYPKISADTHLDTDPIGLLGCTDRCLLTGSQDAVPQCGNGKIENGEDCDGGSACSDQCLAEGTAKGTCGNGKIEVGENCEAVGGVFPPGCKDPAIDGKGCVLLGSASAAHSVCGDRKITDGEACDDGNKTNGDGCSANCLREGTKPSCLTAAAGTACVNYCGNGKQEPGEDEGCDDGVTTPEKAGCNVHTCLFNGTPACGAGVKGACCGDGKVDPGENPACDLAGGVAEGCTTSCLLKGSSSNYGEPSFCRDGLAGVGEAAQCEAGTISPDGNIDPRQVIEAGVPTEENSSTTIVASLPEIVREENKGKATVNLSCTCKEQNDPQAFCAAVGAAKSLTLGCANSGCCAVAPTVIETTPTGGDANQCRNVQVSVVFSDPVDVASVEAGVVLGEAIPVGTTCAAGRETLPDLAYVEAQPGFFGRIWQAIAGFFRSLIGQEAAAQVPPKTPFCKVPGAFVAKGTVARFVSDEALNPSKAYRIYVNSAVVTGVNSVPLAEDYNSVFFTGAELCKIGSVTIEPVSHLFTVAEDLGTGNAADANDGDHNFTATARSLGHGEVVIESKAAYRFDWHWDKTVEAPVEVASPVVVTPTPLANGQGQDAVAVVSVRRGSEGFPKNGPAPILVSAVIPAQNNEPASSISASAKAVVMLCEHPWPERRICSVSHTPTPALPWDADATCSIPGESVWYPFYDKVSNVEFYYCRDTQQAGDATATLPALREDVVRIQPGRDILFEYLFTFDDSTSGPWSKDAIGLRVAKNLGHLPIDAWYRDQGFRGAPTATVVDGQPALAEGRTVYVGAVTRSGDSIYTNVNVLSHSDQAAPETVGVFGKLMENVDFTRNLQDFGYCIDSFGEQVTDTRDVPVSCRADRDCTIGTDGNPDPARLGNSCLVLQSKLVRDVKRFQDLQTLRKRIIGLGAGKFPKLDAGTYLRSQSTSRWPSWTETLGDQLGAVMPEDPLNVFSLCPEGTDPATCFDESKTLYQCPAGSHIYEYQSILNGSDFRLRNDFETACSSIMVPDVCNAMAGVGDSGKAEPFCEWSGNASTGGCVALTSWGGNTCLEVGRDAANADEKKAACTATAGCAWDGENCNFAVGQLEIGGINAAPVCADLKIGEGGICGDGILQGGEECEPIGSVEVESCDLAGGIGSRSRVCKSDCQFSDFTSCKVAVCGDGVVAGDEVCDDGELNGTYGFCNGSCNGQGAQCGDGVRQAQEKCDCGADNGTYIKNGVLDPARSCSKTGLTPATCDFSCSGAAPHCGDNVVNGDEQCDGGFQESVGYCAPIGNLTVANGAPCNTSADCGAGNSCITCPTPEQREHRSCIAVGSLNKSAGAACTYGTWSCTAPGTCGDGTKNTGEECDDGNTNNNDGCVIDVAHNYQCKTASCGDGYVDTAAGEQCDDDGRNGVACVPGYGQTCQYCTTSCRAVTSSGGFCGDGKLQSAGASFCSISGKDCSAKPQVCHPNGIGGQTCTQTTYNCTAADGVCQSQTGPEQCEGTTGLLANYECVSTKPEDRRMGVKSASQCLTSTCKQGCSGQSTLCFNDISASSANFDGDSLSDSCDPDRDNDGVPLDVDCNDFNKDVHGSYLSGTQFEVAAQPEVCGDGVDNDCDGAIDNVAVVNGKVLDLSTGQPVGGALVRAFCGNLEVGRATTTATGVKKGNYSITAVAAAGCTKFDMYASLDDAATPYCFNEYLSVKADVHQCVVGGNTAPAAAPDLYLMPQPPVGAVKADMSWNTSSLDFKLCYNTNEIDFPNDCGNVSSIDTIEVGSGHGRRAMRQSLTLTAPGAGGLPTLMKIYAQALTAGAAKGNGLTIRIWNNACAVTTVTADETTGSATATYWATVLLNTTGNISSINQFSLSRTPTP